jgi:hypothetical protein
VHGAVDIETGELILTVDADALEELVKLMRYPNSPTLPLSRGPSGEGLRPIGSICVEPTAEGAVAIALGDDAATFTGACAGFARLAQELWLFGEYNDLSEPGMHAHFEPGERSRGQIVLAHDSVPMIVVGPVSEDSTQSAESGPSWKVS